MKKKPALPTIARFTPIDDWSTEACHKKIEHILTQIKSQTGKYLDRIDFTTMKLVFHPLLQKDRTANRFEAYWYVLKLYKYHHDFDLDAMEWYRVERAYIRDWVINHCKHKKNGTSPPPYIESDDSWDYVKSTSPSKKPRHGSS